MPNRFMSFFRDEPQGTDYGSLSKHANRQQTMADMLMGRAMQNRAPQQTGAIVPSFGMGEGLAQLGEALIARKMGKRADQTRSRAEGERQRILAAALGGTQYEQAQQAMDAGADPKIVESMFMPKQSANGPFGVVDPSDFTPESMRQFAQSKDYGDLVPVEKEFGRINFRDFTPESISRYQQSGNPSDLERYAERKFHETPGGGVQALDPVSGTAVGQVITPEAATAEAAQRKAAETEATEGQKITTEAQFDLPRVEANTTQALSAINQLLEHPGFSGIFGKSGMLQPQLIPGSDWADANALLEQVRGKTFLEAYNTLKGGGQITEVEGQKAEQAIARLSRAQSDDAAREALLELAGIAEKGLERARLRAGGVQPVRPSETREAGAVNWSDL